MAAREIFDTAAEATVEFTVTDQDIPCQLRQSGIAGVEAIALQETTDEGANWANAYSQGIQIKLSTDQTSIGIVFPGRYRVYKAATVGAVRCVLCTSRDL